MGIEISPARKFENSINRGSLETDCRQQNVQTGSVQKEEQSRENSLYSEAQVIDAIEHANHAFGGVNTRFEFSIHEGTKEIMVKVIDEKTNELIKEIPPEKILDMIAKMWELAGILVDERA